MLDAWAVQGVQVERKKVARGRPSRGEEGEESVGKLTALTL